MTMRKSLCILGTLFIATYFFFFTAKGLQFGFDNDDMYSIYLAWSKPPLELWFSLVEFWRTAFRPLGLLVYLGLFRAFGFDPLPFRIFCLGVTFANVGLCFLLARRISNSERIAALAALLFAFQSRLMEIWWRTATLYDILCFTFVYLALCLYVSVRTEGKMPGAGRSMAILLCYLLAIDSKEMAVVFPVLLVAYEMLFGKRRANWLVVAAALMALIFVVSKTHGGAASMTDPSFRPSYTLERFESNWNGALTHLFLLKNELHGAVSIGILAGLLAIAASLRDRVLLFAWIILFFGAMPVIFIPPRGGYVLYLSYFGWTLFAATLMVRLQNVMLRGAPAYRIPLALACFLLVAWRYGKANLHDQRIDPVKHWLNDSPREVQSFAGTIRHDHPRLPKGTRMLLLKDGFGTDEWTPLFIARLLYDDPGLTVDRVKMGQGSAADWSGYTVVYQFADGAYRQVRP